MQTETTIDARLSGVRAVVPAHVVYRAFPRETVVLNLATGLYHGLNPVAGDMLAALERSPTVLAAAKQLAGEYAEDVERVMSDLVELCDGLAQRGLIELEASS